MTNPPSEDVRAEWRRGWRVVLGAGVGIGTGVSLYLLLASLFVKRVTMEFGWTRGDLALAGAGSFLVAALALAYIGRTLDRLGFRTVVLVCVPALAAVYLGTSLASIVVAPIVAAIIAGYGWRAGAYALIVVMLFVGLPLALWLIGSAKEAHVSAADDVAGDDGVPENLAVTLREALRGPAFWLIAGALVAVNIPGSGVVGQLAPMITDKGLSETQSGLAMSIYAIGLLTARIATGFALDRFKAPNVAAIATGVPALGAALLLVPEPNFALAALAVLLIGMQQGAEIDLLAFFVSRNFGTKHYGAIYGAIAMAGALASAAGLILFGKVHDWTKTYDIALIAGTVAFVIGAGAFFALRLVKKA